MAIHRHNLSRSNMIGNQLMTSEVTDERVLESLRSLQRELFVPEHLRQNAYVDEDIPVGKGRFLMEPLVFGKLLQLMDIAPAHKVLIIGTATGYSAAVMHHLANQVVAIESQRDLADSARKNLRHITKGVEVFTSSMRVGYPMFAPYDLIFIEGAVQQIPANITDQLTEGGKVVTVESTTFRPGSVFGLGNAVIVVKRNGKLHKTASFECSVALLPEFEKKQEFSF